MELTQHNFYGVGTLPTRKLTTKGKIFLALLNGKKLTPIQANAIGNTTEGTRRLREIREDHPLEKRMIVSRKGSNFYEYFFNNDYREALVKELHNIRTNN